MKNIINWIIYVVSVILIVGIVVYIVYSNKFIFVGNPNYKPTPLPEFKLKIVDTTSNSRPIAVMINNVYAARQNHAGLDDAYIVYEIIAEGGISRLMAVFKDKNTTRIGSVRSSRHYYLDYALENDAVYVHYGWSPQAASDMTTLKVNNINGLYDDAFFRDFSLNVSYEHTAYTNMQLINKVINKKGYRTTSDKKLLLNYSIKPIILNEQENSVVANNVSISYADDNVTGFTYNSDEKVYYRFKNDQAHSDAITKKQYTAKNIIVAIVDNYTLNDGSEKGRQTLNNIGTGNGYYITNGYAIPITWEKSSRASQTVYKDSTGKEIKVNDGNTYIQIQPLGQPLTIN